MVTNVPLGRFLELVGLFPDDRPQSDATMEEYIKLIVENVLPAIKDKWPVSSKTQPVHLQQESVGPHAKVDDVELVTVSGRV